MKRHIFTLALILYAASLAESAQGIDPLSSSIPLKGAKKGVYSEKVTRYRIISTHAGFTLPLSPFQKTVSRRSRSGGTEIIVESGEAGTGETPLNKSRLLKNSMYLNTDDPGILRESARISRSSDPVAEAEGFVYRHIRTKTTGIPLLQARQVLRSGTGDCTEHAVLTIALLRAAGIPSRAVVGIILVENYNGERNRLVFHMWAEAFYRNTWHLVDSTRPGIKHHNRYIALAPHSLNTAMPLSYLKAVSAIQNMSVTYAGGE